MVFCFLELKNDTGYNYKSDNHSFRIPSCNCVSVCGSELDLNLLGTHFGIVITVTDCRLRGSFLDTAGASSPWNKISLAHCGKGCAWESSAGCLPKFGLAQSVSTDETTDNGITCKIILLTTNPDSRIINTSVVRGVRDASH